MVKIALPFLSKQTNFFQLKLFFLSNILHVYVFFFLILIYGYKNIIPKVFNKNQNEHLTFSLEILSIFLFKIKFYKKQNDI